MENPSQENEIISNSTPVRDGKPYFMGDHALIKFSGGEEGFGPEVYWLVDKGNNTIRPFESPMALDAAFGDDLSQALKMAVTIVPPPVNSNGDIAEGILADFTILGAEYAIKDDGTSKPLEFSPHQLRSRYGKQIDEKAENLAERAVDRLINALKENEDDTKIPASFLNKLIDNQQLMAFYISALAYGGYTLGDIFSDISNRFNSKEQ